ncbi:MAG: putative licABCH operon regulator [Candidatus Erwinia impunctatus]
MRFPYPRLAQLFELLQNSILPQDELARHFSVSTRTVRTEMAALNELLEAYGARFVLARGQGYQLCVTDDERYQTLKQQPSASLRIPRTSASRVQQLLTRLLTSPFSLKLEDIADEWFVSRATLQHDMVTVREHLARYQLEIESRPRYGMRLFGQEVAVRSCLTDLLYQVAQDDSEAPLITHEALPPGMMEVLRPQLQQCLSRFDIRLTDEGEFFLLLYCAVAVRRISEGYPLAHFAAEDGDDDVRSAARDIVSVLYPLAQKAISPAEEAYLQVNIAARRIEDLSPSTISPDDANALVNYILGYINSHYNFDLQHDQQLHADLLTHIKTMITRIRYQIAIPNPLLGNIKQHYPMAWDVTLAAVSSWGKYTPYIISENEIGFLVLHIGVGLERHYHVGYQQRPRILLVCDSGTSTVRVVESMLRRRYSQSDISRIISLRDYENHSTIEEDIIISTVRATEKDKPLVVISPFPTEYQLEQIGRWLLVDRTRPYMLEKFFDASHFRIIDTPVNQEGLFTLLCEQLQNEGVVDETFLPSVIEREAIISTMLGDGIALPHSLGLLAKKTVVYTVLAPAGISWGDETAFVIFLLAISKTEYEEAMAIYDLFVTFMRDRAMVRLRNSKDFDSFKIVALDCLSRL